jgi:hypothetical protein
MSCFVPYTVATAGILVRGIGALWMNFDLLFLAVITNLYVVYGLIRRRTELVPAKVPLPSIR